MENLNTDNPGTAAFDSNPKKGKGRSGKKILAWTGIGLLVFIAALAVTVWLVWGNEIKTLASMREIIQRNDDHLDGTVYEMTVSGDYYFDEFLAQGGAATDGELISFVTEKITKGLIPMNIDPKDIACSSFTAATEEGDRIFARNYDFSKTNTGIVYTNPGGGRHASVSTVDFQFLGLSVDQEITGLMNKITCLAAPFIPLDGVNDAGVSCGIFMTYQGGDTAVPTDQNTEKPDLTSTTMLRMILDYADSVEEAVEMVSEYDLHDSAKTSYHYMIADSTGKSAILEWVGDTDATDNDGSQRKLNVIYNQENKENANADWQTITNFIITPDYYDIEEDMKGLDRYQHLEERMTELKGVVKDEEQAMELLAEVGRRTWKNDDNNGCTVHSVVYNLQDKNALWVSNEHFGEDTHTLLLELK